MSQLAIQWPPAQVLTELEHNLPDSTSFLSVLATLLLAGSAGLHADEAALSTGLQEALHAAVPSMQHIGGRQAGSRLTTGAPIAGSGHIGLIMSA